MNPQDDFDRRLGAWMLDAVSGRPPAGRFERAMSATGRRRPRPRWLAGFNSDWVGTAVPRRVEWAWGRPGGLVTAAVLALIVAAAILGAALVGAQLQRPHPLAWRLAGLAYSVDGDIYVTAADGGTPVLIAGSYWDPQWSPDGRYLMYEETTTDSSTIYVADPQGRPIASFPGWYGSWAPDSSRIATWGVFPLVDVHTPDGRLVATVTIPANSSAPGDQRVGWSRDGRNIVLPRSWLEFPIDGGAPVEATALPIPPGPYTNPLWSPGGDKIAVTALDSIKVVNVATGTAVTVHTSPPGDLVTATRWSPDGQEILVVQGDGSGVGASWWSVPADGSGGHVLVERADQEGADWRWVEQDSK